MVTVYTIGCPACVVLEKKLIAADIPYRAVNNSALHQQIDIFPMMNVNNTEPNSVNELLTYGEARKWIDNEVAKRKNGNI